MVTYLVGTDGREAALAVFEDAFGDEVTVATRQVNRGRYPSTERVEMARDFDADHIVTGLRRHSRTERIIFGSASQSLLKKVDRPTTLVPLPGYTVTGSDETG